MTKTHISKVLVLFIFSLFLIPQHLYAQTDPNFIIETAVRMVFADSPDMIAVAKCESGYRQFAPDGSVLHGGGGGQYIGIFQIDQNIHRAKALSLGYDINTIDGNIGYARYMFNASGTNPWKGCLHTTTPVATPVTPAVTISGKIAKTLDFGESGTQVLLLQQTLNRLGYQLAATGPGSPGSETDFFGSLTKAAVERFQCDKAIVCSGNSYTTGYGRVGPRTMAAINQAAGL